MENIMKKLSHSSKTSVESSGLSERFAFSSVTEPVDTSESQILKNKVLFVEIFGEEPPTWWGNFSNTVH